MTKKYNGFSLVELLVVIVILGVLAVTAAPKFFNIQTNANNSTLNGLKGAVQSTVEVVYGKLAIRGLESQEIVTSLKYPDIFPTCSIEPANIFEFCSFKYGYPVADYGTLPALMQGVSSIPNYTDWFLYDMTSETNDRGIMFSVKITSNKNVDDASVVAIDNCYLIYKSWYQMKDGSRPLTPEVEVVECR